ncbi:glycosyltransferase family 2 protein [Leuconostoc gelidum subsp. gasicomitatum]|uniref:glycosyltransferase family 2 protein n=1 Tax=Leuconostoc gelidum group TaxID=3016637 RepID=UPI001CC74E37|nr:MULTISPECIES: glycosyltransferase family 2 protein [Leuconostoc gelidum group]MBZ5964363.1 glycosyltransferase family 2 protein [Leuconostoc gelidum subsp. gelidum]MBZ5996178.1 glycosyltransferase family 2 protein [Leuconostoc gasicomitatum]
MHQKRITVIVPVYNGENYISRCINMLLNQEYENYEILIVNDGSTDQTQKVLEKIYKYNSKIRVIETVNQGVSAARNVGIKSAQGEYILFVDSDDKLVENTLQIVNDQLSKHSSELLIFGFSVFGNLNRKNDTQVLKRFENNFCLENKKIIKSLLSTEDNILGYAWRAVYSTIFLKSNEIYFEKHLKISEDYLFLLQAILNATNTIIISQELYEYHIGESSMSNKYVPTLLHDMMWVNDWIYGNLIVNMPELYFEYQYSVTNTYIRFIQNTLRNNNKFNNQIHEISKAKRDFNFQKNVNLSFKHLENFDLKSRIGVTMFRFHLEVIYAILFKLKERKK